MLLGLAIYEINQQHNPLQFNTLDSAPKKNLIGLFPSNALKSLETHSLTAIKADDMQALSPIHFPHPDLNEHHYLMPIPESNHMMAISSRKQLSPQEARYLFINMQHAFKRSNTARVTLENIMINPYGYNGRDCLPDALRENVEELKVILLRDMDKLIERGEKLIDLQKETADIQIVSLEFNNKAQELNKKCCY